MKTLKQLRKEKGLSQRQLGELLHTTGQAIANYETGKRSTQLDFVKNYARVLEITLDEFVEILQKTTS